MRLNRRHHAVNSLSAPLQAPIIPLDASVTAICTATVDLPQPPLVWPIKIMVIIFPYVPLMGIFCLGDEIIDRLAGVV
jgi:hypothetical protein